LLILADLSGIQDYLFQVRETGGKQARSLRFRSLYMQLISEAISVRLLRAMDLDEDRLLFCSAGKLAIDAAHLADGRAAALNQEVREIEKWLRNETHGRLRLNFAAGEAKESVAETYLAANKRLQAAKLRSWAQSAAANGKWQSRLLLSATLPDADEEAARDAEFGEKVTRHGNGFVVFAEGASGAHTFDVAGLYASFSRTPVTTAGAHSRPLDRLARHVPRDPDGNAVEFVELAGRSRGLPMLGVLKADADSLGAAIARRIDGAADLEPLRRFSRRLETFFGQTLDSWLKDDARWSNLYTVFSGGDDVLLVGPWDVVFEFAGHLRERFGEEFAAEDLTISGGVAIVKPKFPIRLAAEQAEDLLHQAKTSLAPRAAGPKDQCAALGQIWKWHDHSTIVAAARRLADWTDMGTIRRGWLHTLLELALLRRGAHAGRDPSMQPAMAASRLVYHLGRNWPSSNDPDPRKSEARKWADRIAAEFDRYEATSDVETIYLPAILRYAMLATRRVERGDDE
jgi:CRISPR-associated protein Csm1